MPLKLPSWLKKDNIRQPAMVPVYSIVVPFYNEAPNVIPLLEELTGTLRVLESPVEVICINDGSTDETQNRLEEALSNYPEIRVLRFEKNAGQSAAFFAGFQASQGEWIITMDGDLQNDPGDIPVMIAASDGHDAVLGIREKRQDNLVRRISSRVANAFRRRITGDRTTDTGCSLKLFKRTLIPRIPPVKGMHRFYGTLLQWEKMDIAEVRVHHRPRQEGSSKYNIRNRLFRSLADLFALTWMQKRKMDYRVVEELPHETAQ